MVITSRSNTASGMRQQSLPGQILALTMRMLSNVCDYFTYYKIPRSVRIRNRILPWLQLFMVVLLTIYVLYRLVCTHSYQASEEVQSAVTTKVDGVVYTNIPNIPGLNDRIWDMDDYVASAEETNAFIVMTNVIVTPQQTQGFCTESPDVKGAECQNDTSCEAGKSLRGGRGVMTGRCIPSKEQSGTKLCQVRAWCPVDRTDTIEKYPYPALRDTENFTVLIKNNIDFPGFDVQWTNMPINSKDYLSKCLYNPNTDDKSCPVFTLGFIVSETGNSYENVSKEGAVIRIMITWDCNLDIGVEKCVPKYSFRRADKCRYKLSCGFQFSYADYYKLPSGTQARTLYQAYGIHFIVDVRGSARKFCFIELMTTFAHIVSYLTITTIFCELLLMIVSRKNSSFDKARYLEATLTNICSCASACKFSVSAPSTEETMTELAGTAQTESDQPNDSQGSTSRLLVTDPRPYRSMLQTESRF